METRANYVLIGLFTLGVIVSAFGFVYWFSRAGGIDDRVTYRVVFDGPVSGLRRGAAVLFNGIRVGEVTDLMLDPAAPRRVVAVVAIEKTTPVRADTWAGLDYQGLTGVAAIALRGGSNHAPAAPGNQLIADSGATQDVTQAARDMLRRLDHFVSDNEAALRSSLRNIEAFSETLANNSDRIDRILAGAEDLLGNAEQPGQIAQAARAIRSAADNLDRRTAEISAHLSTFSQTLANNSGRIDRILAGAENLLGNAERPGEIAEAARAIRNAADSLDRRAAEISADLSRFTNEGLREWSRLASNGRRTLLEIERTFRNIDRNPSRLIFGGPPPEPEKSARR